MEKASLGDRIRPNHNSNAVRVRVKGVSSLVDASRKLDSVTDHNLSKKGKMTDTPVLDLNVTEAAKVLLVGISKKTKSQED